MANIMHTTLKIKGTSEELLNILEVLEVFEYKRDLSFDYFEDGYIIAREGIVEVLGRCFLEKRDFNYSITICSDNEYIICIGGLDFKWTYDETVFFSLSKKYGVSIKINGYEYGYLFEKEQEWKNGELINSKTIDYNSEKNMVWNCQQALNKTF